MMSAHARPPAPIRNPDRESLDFSRLRLDGGRAEVISNGDEVASDLSRRLKPELEVEEGTRAVLTLNLGRLRL